jgi:hypothetical protein
VRSKYAHLGVVNIVAFGGFDLGYGMAGPEVLAKALINGGDQCLRVAGLDVE